MKTGLNIGVGMVMAGASLALGTSQADAANFCGPIPYQPTTGFGGVGGRAEFLCEGTPDGQVDFIGTVSLSFRAQGSNTFETIAEKDFYGDMGVRYDFTAFSATSQPGSYVTIACLYGPMGGPCYQSSALTIKP